MDRVISSHLFFNQRLRPAMLDTLAEAGANGVELFCAGQHLAYTEPPDVRELRDYFSSSPMRVHSLHGPMYPGNEMGRTGAPVVAVLHPERARRIAAMDELKRGLEIGEQIPFRFFVLHLDSGGYEWDEQALEHAITAIEHLRAFARPLGVALAVENLISELTLPERLLEILHSGHFQDVGICLDAGHANVIGRRHALEKSSREDDFGAPVVTRDEVVAAVLADIRTLLPRVVTTHLHDNDGTRDTHRMPGSPEVGNAGVPWPEVMQLLREAPAAPAANLELHSDNAADASTLVTRIHDTWRLLGV